MSKLNELLDLLTSPSSEKIDRISQAYQFSEKIHEGEEMHSENTGFKHAVETAKILAELGSGRRTIAAGLLHDILKYKGVTGGRIEKEFGGKYGPDIRRIVEGIAKLNSIHYPLHGKNREGLVKLLLASAHDMHVLVIKLAERLDTIRNAAALPKRERLRVAREVMDVYVPLAERLGIGSIKRELEDRAFLIINPKTYERVLTELRIEHCREKKSADAFKKSLLKRLARESIPVTETEHRVKSVYSTYKKMHRKGESIYDIKAVRVIVDTVPNCYRVLGIIHTHWRPLPGRIKDYIAAPKPDGYRSIHTSIFVGDGNIIEIQIRTKEMHERAEHGIISHDYYKRHEKNPVSRWFNRFFPPPERGGADTDNVRVKKLPEWLKRVVDAEAYVAMETKKLEALRAEFLKERMFVSDKKGEVVDLPKGATVSDFASALEPDKAPRLSGARVNGVRVNKNYALKNGDIVEIETRKSLAGQR